MTIYNKTGHDVNYKTDRHSLKFDKGECWRIEQSSIEAEGYPIKITHPVITFNFEIPVPTYGVYYIVSKKLKEKFQDRKDFLVPDKIVRDSDNNVLYCQALQS